MPGRISVKYVETNLAITNPAITKSPLYNELILTAPTHNLPHYTKYFVLLSLSVRKNGMMIQMVDRPNTTPIGQDRETLTFKALLYLNVAVHAQVCGLIGLVPAIVQLGPAWLPRCNEYFCC